MKVTSVLGLGPDDAGQAVRISLASGVDLFGTLVRVTAVDFPVEGLITLAIGPLELNVVASQVACWSFARDHDQVDAPLTVASIVGQVAV